MPRARKRRYAHIHAYAHTLKAWLGMPSECAFDEPCLKRVCI
jgi:hypothetical protein